MLFVQILGAVEMEWNAVPQILRDRYETISGARVGPLKIAMLEDMNKGFLPIRRGVDSRSYEVFSAQYNATMLTAHFFENLLLSEDKRHEDAGNYEFQINIPINYFLHPSMDGSCLGRSDVDNISSALQAAKAGFNFSKDQSLVLSQLHKMEFISCYSYFESYVESLMVEFLECSEKKASNKVSNEDVSKWMREAFDGIDINIIQVMNALDPRALDFINFCRRVRNLHMHDLGIVTDRFFKKCKDENLICHDVITETNEDVVDYARPNFDFFDCIIKVGRPINLSGISQAFRLISREIVFISETFCRAGGGWGQAE